MLINFGFEEVNEAVLRNAQIWRYKKILGGKEEIVVLVPEVFASLYYHADKIVTFNSESFRNYSEISNFSPTKSALKRYGLLEKFHSFFYKLSFIRMLSYKLFRRTPRQDRFYIKNGLEKKLLKICKKKLGRSKYIRMSDYYDLSQMSPVLPDLRDWFKTNLEYIEQMIASGDVYRVEKTSQDLEKPLVVLRTRNFKNKAVVHNSKKSILTPLVSELIKIDCDVVNIGTPHLPLDINHPNYKEYTHNMNIEDEFALCGKASCVVMTTEAGNFNGFSATDVNIVQYDDEIFERCFKSPISLLGARKQAGLDDLDIRDYIKSESWSLAAKAIYEFAVKEKQGLEENHNSHSQERIDLGLI